MSSSFTSYLLEWYQENKRQLPWRLEKPDPYRTWLSEIMLQQTTVATVIPYYEEFLMRWPTLEALAKADLDDVLHAWQGLGYYSRARNLHKCAQVVWQDYGGVFPKGLKELLKLPGIGPYTAGAVASIAHSVPAVAIDGNVLRVISRHQALSAVRPKLDKEVEGFLQEHLSEKHPGDFTQGLMELGATLCRPKNPECAACPVQASCKAFAQGNPADYPVKVLKKKIPTKYATAFFLQREDGAIYMRRREESEMLGGMMEIPTSPWVMEPANDHVVDQHAPCAAEWMETGTSVKHTFSHFHFEVDVLVANVSHETLLPQGVWVKDPADVAVPTVMKKVIQAASKSLRMGA